MILLNQAMKLKVYPENNTQYNTMNIEDFQEESSIKTNTEHTLI